VVDHNVDFLHLQKMLERISDFVNYEPIYWGFIQLCSEIEEKVEQVGKTKLRRKVLTLSQSNAFKKLNARIKKNNVIYSKHILQFRNVCNECLQFSLHCRIQMHVQNPHILLEL
jgi:hypothetical protein